MERSCRGTKRRFYLRLQTEDHIIAAHPDVMRIIEKGGTPHADNEQEICSVTRDKGPIARLHPIIKGVRVAIQPAQILFRSTASRPILWEKATPTHLLVKQQRSPIRRRSMRFLASTRVSVYRSAILRLSSGPRRGVQLKILSPACWATPLKMIQTGTLKPWSPSIRLRAPGTNLQQRTTLSFRSRPRAQCIADIGAVLAYGYHSRCLRPSFTIFQGRRNIPGFYSKASPVTAPLALFHSSTGPKRQYPANLVSETVRAIVDGTAFPATLLQAAVRRNRAAQEVTYPRAALIKACLNRTNRYYSNNQKELTVCLDPANLNVGYILGRLFSVLEKIRRKPIPA